MGGTGKIMALSGRDHVPSKPCALARLAKQTVGVGPPTRAIHFLLRDWRFPKSRGHCQRLKFDIFFHTHYQQQQQRYMLNKITIWSAPVSISTLICPNNINLSSLSTNFVTFFFLSALPLIIPQIMPMVIPH